MGARGALLSVSFHKAGWFEVIVGKSILPTALRSAIAEAVAAIQQQLTAQAAQLAQLTLHDKKG